MVLELIAAQLGAYLIWIIPAVIVLIIIGLFVFYYNQFVNLNNLAQADWKQIDTFLQQRLDLIPNLVEIAKRVMKQELDLFKGIAQARESALRATDTNARIEANRSLDGLLSNFQARAEAYPQMKSNEAMVRVMEDLRGIEDRIRAGRGEYNNSVLAYINAVTLFPGSIFAGMFGFKGDKWSYYEAEAAARPGLKLGPMLK